MFNERIVAFGDLHLNWQALEAVLNFADQEGIRTMLNLGDEGHRLFQKPDWTALDKIYSLLTQVKSREDRRLICVKGNDTQRIPPELRETYVTVKAGKYSIPVFKEENVIAGHTGDEILAVHRADIAGHGGNDSLVIFHGHSHSMGVLPEYRWLKAGELVNWIPEGERHFDLEKGKVYWVNPGTSMYDKKIPGIANLAIYDPGQSRITLKSLRYDHVAPEPGRIPGFIRLLNPFN